MQAPLKDKNDIKIFILYLLGSVGYPLDFNTISDIVVQDDFVGYFDFAECFAELVDCGNIEIVHAEPNDLYRITPNGRLVAEQLQSNILGMMREKSLRSAMRLLSFKSRGSDVKMPGRGERGRKIRSEVRDNREGRSGDGAEGRRRLEISARPDDDELQPQAGGRLTGGSFLC